MPVIEKAHRSNVVQAISEAQRSRSISAGQAYHRLVIDSAAGVHVDPDEATEIIESAGRTFQQFDADVATMETRIVHAERLTARPAATEALRSAESRLQTKVNAWRAKEAEHHAECRAIANEIDKARVELAAIANAEDRLRKTCIDPTIEARREQLGADRRRVHLNRERVKQSLSVKSQKIAKISQTLAKLNESAQSRFSNEGRSKIYHEGQFVDQGEIDRLERMIAEEAPLIKSLKSELADLDEQYQEIEQRGAELRDAELLP